MSNEKPTMTGTDRESTIKDEEPSPWLNWCRNELELAGKFYEDIEESTLDTEYWNAVREAVLGLCEVFSSQNHSGFSAAAVASVFEGLVRWHPLTPLTGEDDEWIDTGEGPYMADGTRGKLFQNKRCPSVFKDETGRAFQTDHYVFVEEDGSAYTSSDSVYYIDEFPFMPWTEKIYLKPSIWARIRKWMNRFFNRIKRKLGKEDRLTRLSVSITDLAD